MSFPIMMEDAIKEIFTYFPTWMLTKCRVLNNEYNKFTYESWFSNLNINRTNYISGYFLQHVNWFKIYSSFAHDRGIIRGNKISIDFLPPGKVRIEACDASHGILLCVNDSPDRGRVPNYIVCKPTTKEYRIIPNPKTRYFTITLGLIILNSDLFRFKIVRLSKSLDKNNRCSFYRVCEVFDSGTYLWKRLRDVEIPNGFILNHSVAIASYGFLHWLSTNNRVYRFCFKTETWSSFPVPEELTEDLSLKLITYKGKLGIMSLESRKDENFLQLWVLENWSENSWTMIKHMILKDNYKPIWFPNSDVVSMAEVGRIFNFNVEKKELWELQIKNPIISPDLEMTYFPFIFDYKRVALDRNEANKIGPKSYHAL